MKKILMVLGAITLLLIILAACGIGYMMIQGPKLDASSKAFVDEHVQTFISAWSKDEFEKMASQELQQVLTGERWDIFLSKVKLLGAFQNYEGSKGEAFISFTFTKFSRGQVVTANYIASASFKNGPAEITVKLIRKNGQWQFDSFTVTSPVFKKE